MGFKKTVLCFHPKAQVQYRRKINKFSVNYILLTSSGMIVRMNNQSSFCYDNRFLAVISILIQYIQYIHNFFYIHRFKSVLTYKAKNIKTILQYKESRHVIVIEWHRKTSLGGSQNNGQREGGDHCCPHCDFTHLVTFYEDSIITSKLVKI